MKVDEMPAGRELDALVAEKVMGWRWFRPGDAGEDGYPVDFWCDAAGDLTGWCDRPWPDDTEQWGDAPALFSARGTWQPSQNIEVAWEVVEKLARRGFIASVASDGADRWVADFAADPLVTVCTYAPTAPLAICRAALKAAGIEEA